MHSFDVEVVDPENAKTTGRVTVELVNANFPPSTTSPSVDASEGLALGAVVFDGSATSDTPLATDSDGDSITYTVTKMTPPKAADSLALSISGVLTVVFPGLDFENSQTHIIEYLAQDSGNGRLQTAGVITVNVQNEPEAPTLQGFDINQDENQAVGTIMGTVSSFDDDDDATATFVVQVRGTGVASTCFDISMPRELALATGVTSTSFEADMTLKDASCLNFEIIVGGRIELDIIGTDNDGMSSNTTALIRVNDVNESPSTEDAEGAVSEVVVPGTEVVFVPCSDPDNE